MKLSDEKRPPIYHEQGECNYMINVFIKYLDIPVYPQK